MRCDDRGSGTVLVLAIVVVATVLAMTLAGLGQVVVARARAQSAADLAALAAASHLRATSDAAASCVLADDVVARNSAVMSMCTDEGTGVVGVTVTVSTVFGATSAAARAGPASAR